MCQKKPNTVNLYKIGFGSVFFHRLASCVDKSPLFCIHSQSLYREREFLYRLWAQIIQRGHVDGFKPFHMPSFVTDIYADYAGSGINFLNSARMLPGTLIIIYPHQQHIVRSRPHFPDIILLPDLCHGFLCPPIIYSPPLKEGALIQHLGKDALRPAGASCGQQMISVDL